MTELQVIYFLKVTEHMSFSAAAQELFVSQPSVSRQIRMLEKELGYTLFDRTRKNAITLTAEGMVFREGFRRARKSYEEALSAARAVSEAAGLELRIGIGEGWDLSEFLSGVRKRVLADYPQANVSVECGPFLELRRQVHAGQFDVILCTQTGVQDFDGVEVEPVGQVEERIYVRKGMGEEPERFKNQTLLMLPESEAPMATQIVLLQLLEHRMSPAVRYLPNRDSIYQGILMGEGFAVFDSLMWIAKDSRISTLPLGNDVPLCAVWNKNCRNPLIHFFVEEVKDYFAARRGSDLPQAAPRNR